MSVGVDQAGRLTGEGLGILGFDGTRATHLEGWLGHQGAAGIKLGHLWLWGDATRADTYGDAKDVWVAKTFLAVDRNEFDDRKGTVGFGMERNNRFVELYYEHALSGERLLARTLDTVVETITGEEDGRPFQQDITTTTVFERFSRPYEHGLGFRVGRFCECSLLRVRGGLDYAWSDEMLEGDRARQWGATATAEKFIAGSGHSLALELGWFRKDGPFDAVGFGGREDEDLRASLRWRYEFGRPYRPASSAAADDRPAPWVERALRNLPQHRREVDTYTIAKSTVTTTEGPRVFLNRAPVAVDDAYTTPFGTPLQAPTPPILANDSDPDGDSLSDVDLIADVAHGTLALAANGAIEYTPDAGFSGQDTFTYVVHDPTGAPSNVATVTITVGPSPQPPEAVDDTYSVRAGDVLDVVYSLNDIDHDGDALPLACTILSPTNFPGTVSALPGCRFQYQPDSTFAGTVSFDYVATDSNGLQSNQATVTITVNAAPLPPEAVDDSYSVQAGDMLDVVYSLNDIDHDGDALPLACTILSPTNFPGTVSALPGCRFQYQPDSTFAGTVSFDYVATDSNGLQSNQATVTIVVSATPLPTNQAPVAVPDNFTTPFQTPLTNVNLLLNGDNDPDGDAIFAQILTAPANGTLTKFNTDGSFEYVPNQNFSGQDSFFYRVIDDQGAASDPVIVTITVEDVPG